MIATSGLAGLLVTLVIFGLIMWVLWWGLGKIALPEPFAKIATVILVLVTVVFLVDLLMGLGGRPLLKW